MQPKCRALKCYAQTIMNLPASPPPAAAVGNFKQAACRRWQRGGQWPSTANAARDWRLSSGPYYYGVSNSRLIEMQFLSRVMATLS